MVINNIYTNIICTENVQQLYTSLIYSWNWINYQFRKTKFTVPPLLLLLLEKMENSVNLMEIKNV